MRVQTYCPSHQKRQLDFGQGHRSRPVPHGTCGFSHFSTSMSNQQRQAVSDGINSESQYSGGQWFLNHLCGWTRSASTLRCNNTLVTRVGVSSVGTVSVESIVCFVYREMAGYLEDGRQLHYDDKVFMTWGSTLNQESHLSSYNRYEGGQKQLLI